MSTVVEIAASAFVVLLACAGLHGCGGGETYGSERSELAGKLTITGSSTCAPLVSEMAKRFESLHPGLRIDVQTGGSSRGIADAQSGMADIGMVSRSLAQDELGLQDYPFARDGVCMIVHGDNPIGDLSREQVQGIYRGEFQNWREVGGPDAEITVVNKAEGRATLKVFLDYMGLSSQEVEADIVIAENEQGVKTIAGNPHAIGYVSIGSATANFELGVPIRLLPLNGIRATAEAVADGSFPMARPLLMVTAPQPNARAQAFLEYARSSAVHDLMKDYSLVPTEL